MSTFLLSIFHVPGTGLGSRDTVINRTIHKPYPHGVYSLVRQENRFHTHVHAHMHTHTHIYTNMGSQLSSVRG